MQFKAENDAKVIFFSEWERTGTFPILKVFGEQSNRSGLETRSGASGRAVEGREMSHARLPTGLRGQGSGDATRRVASGHAGLWVETPG